jgi:nitroreductase
MNIDELKELLTRRASHRKHQGDSIPEDDIKSIVEAARHAPSAHNTQPWRVLALTQKDLIVQLAQTAVTEYEKTLPQDAPPELRNFSFYAGHFREAPAALVILTKKSTFPFENPEYRKLYGLEPPEYTGFDLDSLGAGAFTQNILLAATALGYATCWVAAPCIYAQERIEEILKIRAPWKAVSIISLSRPVKERKGAPKKELSEILEFVP